MTSSPLTIKLLGPVEIAFNEKPVNIGRRMERAILYFLAAENRPVSRTSLIDLLWDDEDQVDHRSALRTALSRLRNELPDADVLMTELDQVWLDPERCWVDLVNFTTSYNSLNYVMRAYQNDSVLPAQIVEQIEEDLALWRGDEILQGDNLTTYPEIENWRKTLNRKHSHQRRTLMEKLALHYRASGKLDPALDLYSQLGRMDLLEVNFHLSVLDILTKMRRFQEAVDYCDALEIAYEREFNAALPELILKQYQYSQIQLKAGEQKTASEWPVSLTMQLPLVGRDKELEQLQKAFYTGGIFVIKGELGSGKTRLVQELFQSFNPTPKLFFAPSQEMEISMPLSPIVHGLRHHVSQEIWETIDCVWASKMSLLLPELAEYREDCLDSQYSGTPTAKQQLFDAILHVFQTMTQNNTKILFFLDDAQWADKLTLEAISYMVSQGFFDEKGLLIISSRKEEPNRDLTEMVDRLYRTQEIQTINLTGLRPNDLGALVSQALHETPSSGFLDQLYRETNGNPFLAQEIVRNLLEFSGDFDKFTSSAQLPLPENVHAIIRKRLNSLDEPARRILRYAAVIGNEFPLDLLRAVTGSGQQFDMGLLDPLIKFGFVHPSGQEGSQKTTLQFVHEIMREVVLKEATTVQLKTIHHRVAENLAEKPLANEQAALIANHYLACGEIHSAFHWYIKAAEHAWALGAKDDTQQIFQQAESLYKNAPLDQFTNVDIFELYRHWGQFAYEANMFDLLEEIGIKIQYLGEQEHDPLLLGLSQMTLANACFLRLRMDTGLELITKAIDYLKHTGHKQIMMEAKLRQAAFHWWLLDYDETIQVAQEVLEIGESQISDPQELNDSLFFARHGIAYSYYAQGNAKKALNYTSDIYDRYFHLLSPFNRMRMMNVLANSNLLAANFKSAKTYANQGLDIAKNLGNSFLTQNMLITLSKAETIRGEMDEAFAHASKALKMGEVENYTHTIISANCVIGNINQHLQNYNLALQHYRVAQLRGGYLKDSLYSLENDLYLARTLPWMGQLKEARELAAHALEVTQRYRMTHLHTMALLSLALCDIHERNLSGAEAYIVQAERFAGQNGLVFEQTWCTIGRARMALSRHQFDFAEEKIKAILEVSDQHNMAWLKLRGLNFCSQLHKATQKPSLLRYRSEYQDLIKRLSEHTQSDPLRKSFESAQQFWGEGHAYP